MTISSNFDETESNRTQIAECWKSSSCNIVKMLETRSTCHTTKVSSKKANNRSLSRSENRAGIKGSQCSPPGSECGLERGHPHINRRMETRRTATTKGSAESPAFHSAQTLQHGLAGHQIKRPNAINRQLWVRVRQCLHHVCYALSASTRC